MVTMTSTSPAHGPKWMQRRYEPQRPDYKQETIIRPGRGPAGKKPDDGIALFFLEADIGGCEKSNTAKNYQLLHVGDHLNLALKENGFIAVSFQKGGESYHLGFLQQCYAIKAGLFLLLGYPSAFGVVGDVYTTVTELDLEDPKWPRAYIDIRCLTDVRLRHTKKGFLVTPDETVAVKLLKPHEKIAIPDGIKEIAPCALLNEHRVRSITLPAGLQKIGHHAFASTNIGIVNLPSTVEYIGDDAFADCPEDRRSLFDNRKFSYVYYNVEKGNKRYKSDSGNLIDKRAPETGENHLSWDILNYVTISMPWANSGYMKKCDKPAFAKLMAQREALHKEKWAHPTPTMLANKCIKELRARDSSSTLESVLAKIDKLSGLKRNELIFTIANYGSEEQFNMMLDVASQIAENLSFLYAEAISLNDHKQARQLALVGTQLHGKRMRIPDKTQAGNTILCTPIELAMQDIGCKAATGSKAAAHALCSDNSSCIAKLAEEGFFTREILCALFQSAWQSTTPFAQERLQVIVRFVHPDDVADKVSLCKNLIAHKAEAELEHVLSWPDFPNIDQAEELVQFANGRSDTEATVHILEAYRKQQPPDPTEGLLL